MTLTVRLESELEDQLEAYCQAAGTTKTAVVTQALREFFSSLRQQRTPYEVYQQIAQDMGLTEKAPGKATDHSIHYRQHIKELLKAKHGG